MNAEARVLLRRGRPFNRSSYLVMSLALIAGLMVGAIALSQQPTEPTVNDNPGLITRSYSADVTKRSAEGVFVEFAVRITNQGDRQVIPTCEGFSDGRDVILTYDRSPVPPGRHSVRGVAVFPPHTGFPVLDDFEPTCR